MRTAPTGPLKGSGEIINAAEAPLMQRMSCGVTRSAESTVQITCTSLRKPFGHNGRIGRSIMRAVRIARSVGRPSRLKKPPGIFPAAYIRSSTSTVRGKKSAPSRASMRPCAVASTIVSPERTTTAPSACLASLPVSKLISCSPTVNETAVTLPVATLMSFLHFSVESGGLSQRRPVARSLKLPLSGSITGPLSPQAQLLDQSAIALQVRSLEVVEQSPAPADELEQPATRVMVLRVRAQMPGELVDPGRQHGDLHLRGTGVGP